MNLLREYKISELGVEIKSDTTSIIKAIVDKLDNLYHFKISIDSVYDFYMGVDSRLFMVYDKSDKNLYLREFGFYTSIYMDVNDLSPLPNKKEEYINSDEILSLIKYVSIKKYKVHIKDIIVGIFGFNIDLIEMEYIKRVINESGKII